MQGADLAGSAYQDLRWYTLAYTTCACACAYWHAQPKNLVRRQAPSPPDLAGQAGEYRRKSDLGVSAGEGYSFLIVESVARCNPASINA